MSKLDAYYEREVKVEKYLVDEVTALGGLCEKFTSPGKRGVPDRLVTLPGLPMELVELKTVGGHLYPWQKRDHRERAKRGQHVPLLWTFDQVDEYIAEKRSQLQARNI